MSGHATALKRARQVREVLLDYGVPEVSIELVPGRPVPAGRDRWNALDPVAHMSHHIASNPTPANPTPGLALVKGGRADLGGPLCNGTAGVDLVYRILCLGWANHPGYGGPLTVRGPAGVYVIPKDQARPYAWGTEYEGGYSEAVWDRTYRNRRTGKKMTFREFMGRCNAGLSEAIWLPGLSSRGVRLDPGVDLSGYLAEHKTWAPGRKPDRLGYTTDSGRAEARPYYTDHGKDEGMSWTTRLRNFKNQGGEERSAGSWLLRTFNTSHRTDLSTRRIEARLASMEKRQEVLLDRSLTDAERDARLQELADQLAADLTAIEVEIKAEVSAAGTKEDQA